LENQNEDLVDVSWYENLEYFIDGYKVSTTLPTDEVGNKIYYSSARAMNSIQGILVET
jgi:hypothetical protein